MNILNHSRTLAARLIGAVLLLAGAGSTLAAVRHVDVVNHCTVTGNSADSFGEGGGAADCSLSDCIVYFNTGHTHQKSLSLAHADRRFRLDPDWPRDREKTIREKVCLAGEPGIMHPCRWDNHKQNER